MTAPTIDLNADMGEYSNHRERDNEAALMPLISSCSIACGGHAGDEKTMRATVRLAQTHGVSIGAHPAYPDREGFGRRNLEYEADFLQSSLREQVASLKAVATEEGAKVRHVKPHGALYNAAAKNIALASLVAKAAEGLILVGPPGSALEEAAEEAGLVFAAEGFVDRLYQSSGALTPRTEAGAIIENITARADQALAIAGGNVFKAADGNLKLSVKTLCIHSDSPGAVETAKATRAKLEENGFTIRSFA